jgi:hypothetical protein
MPGKRLPLSLKKKVLPDKKALPKKKISPKKKVSPEKLVLPKKRPQLEGKENTPSSKRLSLSLSKKRCSGDCFASISNEESSDMANYTMPQNSANSSK